MACSSRRRQRASGESREHRPEGLADVLWDSFLEQNRATYGLPDRPLENSVDCVVVAEANLERFSQDYRERNRCLFFELCAVSRIGFDPDRQQALVYTTIGQPFTARSRWLRLSLMVHQPDGSWKVSRSFDMFVT